MPIHLPGCMLGLLKGLVCIDKESSFKLSIVYMHLTERASKTMFLRDHFSGRFQTMFFVGYDKVSNCQDDTLVTYILDNIYVFSSKRAFNKSTTTVQVARLVQTPRKNQPREVGYSLGHELRLTVAWFSAGSLGSTALKRLDQPLGNNQTMGQASCHRT